MSINLNVRNAMDDSTISIEVDENDSAGDIMVFSAQYWNKNNHAIILKVGNKLIPANRTVQEIGLRDGDTVIVVPDPQGG